MIPIAAWFRNKNNDCDDLAHTYKDDFCYWLPSTLASVSFPAGVLNVGADCSV